MNRRLIHFLLLLALGVACSAPSEVDLQQATRDFYEAMSRSDIEALREIYLDSVRVKEGDFNDAFSLEEYALWLGWDSVFRPTYEILELEVQEESTVALVSKTCRRTLFLHGGPVVTKEKLHFQDGRVYRLEIVDYVGFDGQVWNGSRAQLLNWIDDNYPEMSGFIYDQTRKGGWDYLRAIQLYETEGPGGS